MFFLNNDCQYPKQKAFLSPSLYVQLTPDKGQPHSPLLPSECVFLRASQENSNTFAKNVHLDSWD